MGLEVAVEELECPLCGVGGVGQVLIRDDVAFPLENGKLRGLPEPVQRAEHPLGLMDVAIQVVLTVDQ